MEISLMQAHKRTKLRAPVAACVNTPHSAACSPDLSAGKRGCWTKYTNTSEATGSHSASYRTEDAGIMRTCKTVYKLNTQNVFFLFGFRQYKGHTGLNNYDNV